MGGVAVTQTGEIREGEEGDKQALSYHTGLDKTGSPKQDRHA